jgi:hypothetical protein
MQKAEAAQVEMAGKLESTPHKAIPRKGKVFAALCVPVVILAIYYAPTLTSFGWHILHGKAIDYRGLHVEVPWGWTADLTAVKDDFPANPQGITLQKPPKTLSIEARGPELIYINLLLPDARSSPQQQAAEWKSLFSESHSGSDFDVAAPASFPPGTDCLEATPKSKDRSAPTGAALACISLQGGWLANYAGSRANVPLFMSVIGDLKPQR